jgi:hypothetical protein
MASQTEISDELQALSLHYFRMVRSPEDHERWIADYAEALKVYPVEAIRAGCRAWRESAADKFPKVGQLLPYVRDAAAPKAERTVTRAWEPPTQEEYDALSLREKMRQQSLLGTQAKDTAYREAMRAGWDRNIASAPDCFGFWMARAEGHFAEANRLRSKLASYGDAA